MPHTSVGFLLLLLLLIPGVHPAVSPISGSPHRSACSSLKVSTARRMVLPSTDALA